MLFYNLNKLDIDIIYDKNKYIIIPIKLIIPAILNLSYNEYVTVVHSQIAAQIDKSKLNISQPTLFQFELITDDKLTFDDVDQFYVCSFAALSQEITTAFPRNREQRLTVDTKNININYNILYKLTNFITLTDVFTVSFKYNNIIIAML